MGRDQHTKIMNFIRYETREGRGFPSADKIAQHLGVQTQTAQDQLMAMAAAGDIDLKSRRPYGRGYAYEWALPDKKGDP